MLLRYLIASPILLGFLLTLLHMGLLTSFKTPEMSSVAPKEAKVVLSRSFFILQSPDVFLLSNYQHHDDALDCTVLQTAAGMLREVVESVHEVFVFKLVVFLLATVEKGGRDNVLRFLRSGGATILVPLVVLSLAKCCTDKHEFECDASTAKDVMSQGAVETVTIVGSNGDVRLVRIPSGRAHELLERAEQDGSLDAREAIKWQDEKVHVKIQLGIALDFLEALLRISGRNSNVEHFPPSAACCNFSREEIFCHLVQALLRAKTPIFNRFCFFLVSTVKFYI
jgi:DnaJ family protein C protein 13